MMKLEVGNGRKVGPMVKKWGADDDGDNWGFGESDACYDEQGIRWVGAGEPESDLIEEWTDEPAQPTLSGITIDHIAIDSLKHHYTTEMEPLQKEAFRIVLRYYGVTV